MAISFVGLPDWWLTSEEDGRPYLELPTLSQTWKMKYTKYASFKAEFAEGTAYGGGYIVDFRGKDQGMLPEATITIALAPNFQAYTLATSRATQTSSKGRTVENSSIIDGADSVEAQRTMTFIAPQSIYTYWASVKPAGPRFTNPTETSAPTLLKSVITATANGSTRTYYGNAPSALVSALDMPAVGLITGHQADPVAGTPWYRCQDTISYVYRGDDA